MTFFLSFFYRMSDLLILQGLCELYFCTLDPCPFGPSSRLVVDL